MCHLNPLVTFDPSFICIIISKWSERENKKCIHCYCRIMPSDIRGIILFNFNQIKSKQDKSSVAFS